MAGRAAEVERICRPAAAEDTRRRDASFAGGMRRRFLLGYLPESATCLGFPPQPSWKGSRSLCRKGERTARGRRASARRAMPARPDEPAVGEQVSAWPSRGGARHASGTDRWLGSDPSEGGGGRCASTSGPEPAPCRRTGDSPPFVNVVGGGAVATRRGAGCVGWMSAEHPTGKGAEVLAATVGANLAQGCEGEHGLALGSRCRGSKGRSPSPAPV